MSNLDPYEVVEEELKAWEDSGLEAVAVNSDQGGGVVLAGGQYLSLVDSGGDVTVVSFHPGELEKLAKEILRKVWL